MSYSEDQAVKDKFKAILQDMANRGFINHDVLTNSTYLFMIVKIAELQQSLEKLQSEISQLKKGTRE